MVLLSTAELARWIAMCRLRDAAKYEGHWLQKNSNLSCCIICVVVQRKFDKVKIKQNCHSPWQIRKQSIKLIWRVRKSKMTSPTQLVSKLVKTGNGSYKSNQNSVEQLMQILAWTLAWEEEAISLGQCISITFIKINDKFALLSMRKSV